MSTAVQSVKDTVNVKKNGVENPVKRAVAKLRHPMRAQVSDWAAGQSLETSSGANQEPHVATGEFAASASHSVLKEFSDYLQDAEGDAALRKIAVYLTTALRENAVELLLSDEFQATARMAGRETLFGASEALEQKLSANLEKLPKVITVSILPFSAVFVGLFMLGLLLALWRFALFGLQNRLMC